MKHDQIVARPDQPSNVFVRSLLYCLVGGAVFWAAVAVIVIG